MVLLLMALLPFTSIAVTNLGAGSCAGIGAASSDCGWSGIETSVDLSWANEDRLIPKIKKNSKNTKNVFCIIIIIGEFFNLINNNFNEHIT
jgi:hypothetical protein